MQHINDKIDQSYLLRALDQAIIRRGYCAPNPAVGVVLVKNGHVLATGLHWAAGYPHAEVDALSRLQGDEAKGATLYVTLEPCCHQGRTPPCTTAIIRSGIQRIVFAYYDPNPKVSGAGIAVLRAAGVVCDYCPLPAIHLFYRSYVHWIRYKKPWVTAKLAMTADYKIADHHRNPVPITGEACDRLTHESRHRSDAILTTATTILQDNPKMNVRLPYYTYPKPLFVLDRQLRVRDTCQIFRTAASITLYHQAGVRAAVQQARCCTVTVPCGSSGLDLTAVLTHMGEQGLHDIWVEAGATLLRSLYSQRLLNQLILYRSRQYLGQHALSAFFSDCNPLLEQPPLNWEALGRDEVACLVF